MHIKNLNLFDHISDFPLLYVDCKMNNTCSTKRKAIVNEAESLIGSPYTFGENGPNSFDCAGFVQYVYKKSININIPKTLIEQLQFGDKINLLSSLLPGDLVFLSNGTHVGIYIGNNEFIHAPYYGQRVKSSSVIDFYCGRRYI